MSPPTGIWAAVIRALHSPLTLGLAACALGVAALLGAASSFGQHPAAGPGAQLALALVVSCLIARTLAQPDVRSALPYALWTLGAVSLAVGALMSGGEAGELRMRAGEVETYEQVINGRGAATHLGGRLAVTDGARLRLLVKERVLADVPLPTGVDEANVVGWRMHQRSIDAGTEPTHARLSIRPRSGGDAKVWRLRADQTVALGDDVQITVRRLVGDYGKALGPAALIDVATGDTTRSAWHFAEAPDLDARVGEGLFVITLEQLDVAPIRVLGARRTDASMLPLGLSQFGLALMALGMLLGGLRKEQA
ncbi:MAG: hypothetical protein ACI9U2_004215 [Bradymonadia bacterium]|jgi:hypothetical protein